MNGGDLSHVRRSAFFCLCNMLIPGTYFDVAIDFKSNVAPEPCSMNADNMKIC